MKDRIFKEQLLAMAGLQPGQRVLDFGCGTGTLAVRAKELQPEADVVGLDVDPRMIEQAERLSRKKGLHIAWKQSTVDQLTDADGQFDVVLSSLVFHHLATEEKQSSLAHLFRILCPGGKLLIADFGKPAGPLMALAFLGVRLFDGFEPTSANVAGRLPVLIKEAGFSYVGTALETSTIFGTLALMLARRPA